MVFLRAYLSSWPGLTRPSTTFFLAKTWMPGTSPGMTSGRQPNLRLVRIEPLFQSLPAIGVIILQRRRLRRIFRHPLRKARLEHEGHGARQLHRLQLAIAGVLERVAVGAVRQHAIVQ